MKFIHQNNQYKLSFHYKKVIPNFKTTIQNYPSGYDNPFKTPFGPWQEVDFSEKVITTTKLKSVHIQTMTALSIFDNDKKEYKCIAIGYATCVHGDQFSKKIGRRMAINNMFYNFPTDKELRVAMGHEYNKQIKG